MTRRLFLFSAAVLLLGGAAGRVVFKSSPNDKPAIVTAAPGLSQLAQRDDEIRVWRQALEADPRSAESLARLAALHLQRAREGGGWSDYLTAESYARRSLAIRTAHNAKTAVTLASALLAQHRFAEAQDVAQTLVRQEPDVPQYRSLLGEVAMELGDYDTASQLDSLWAARGMLSVAPRIARWQELTGHPDVAMHLLLAARREALTRADVPSETKSWFDFRTGDLALRLGHIDDAERYFRHGLTIEPEDPRQLAAMARLAAVTGHPKQAIAWGERAIVAQLDPATLGVVGDAYAARGDTARAQEYFRTMEVAVSAQPGPFHRAWSLYLLDHGLRVNDVLARARAEMEQRRDVYGYDLVAWALYRSGQADAGACLMVEALRLGTPDATLWFHDGMIARARGDSTRARASLDRALTLNPFFHATQPKEARAVVDSLRRGR